MALPVFARPIHPRVFHERADGATVGCISVGRKRYMRQMTESFYLAAKIGVCTHPPCKPPTAGRIFFLVPNLQIKPMKRVDYDAGKVDFTGG
jgi:hypothetical protein